MLMQLAPCDMFGNSCDLKPRAHPDRAKSDSVWHASRKATRAANQKCGLLWRVREVPRQRAVSNRGSRRCLRAQRGYSRNSWLFRAVGQSTIVARKLLKSLWLPKHFSNLAPCWLTVEVFDTLSVAHL